MRGGIRGTVFSIAIAALLLVAVPAPLAASSGPSSHIRPLVSSGWCAGIDTCTTAGIGAGQAGGFIVFVEAGNTTFTVENEVPVTITDSEGDAIVPISLGLETASACEAANETYEIVFVAYNPSFTAPGGPAVTVSVNATHYISLYAFVFNDSYNPSFAWSCSYATEHYPLGCYAAASFRGDFVGAVYNEYSPGGTITVSPSNDTLVGGTQIGDRLTAAVYAFTPNWIWEGNVNLTNSTTSSPMAEQACTILTVHRLANETGPIDPVTGGAPPPAPLPPPGLSGLITLIIIVGAFGAFVMYVVTRRNR